MLCTELFVQRTDCCRCLYYKMLGSVLHEIVTPTSTWAFDAREGVQFSSSSIAKPILSSAVSIFESKARSPAMKLTGHLHKTGRLLHREEQAPASLSDESLSAPSGFG